MITSGLPEFIYSGNNIPEILRLYENELRKGNDFESIAHAGAIQGYRILITDKKFLNSLRKTFDALYQILEKEIPDLRFRIEGRRKSLISSEDKIIKLLNENKSMDLFRDMFAFRIIIFGGTESNSIELIEKCYSSLNQIITYLVSTGLTLCEEDQIKHSMQIDDSKRKNLIIPKKSGISKKYLYGVKDYILNPKENGYQSIHCVFRTKSGYCFEIQVKTLGMHVVAESGNAEHKAYKKKKYINRIQLDKSKVHLPGYEITNSGEVFDFIGLEHSLTIFHRQKTF